MKTVRITLAMALALSIAVPVMAQKKEAAQRKGRKLSTVARVMLRMGKLREAMEGLDVTAEQQEKLSEVRAEMRPKMEEAFAKLQEILTSEQQATAQEASRDARDAGKEGRALMLAVESSLKLTDEQKEKTDKLGKEVWLPLRREMTKKVMAILTPEQKETVQKAIAPKNRKAGKSTNKKNKPRD